MAGRPTKMTKARLGKLREAFLFGATDEEACLFAQIHPDTLYEYQKQNRQFSEQKDVWKKNPILKASQTVFNNLDNPKIAMWYLERRVKSEFYSKYLPDVDEKPVRVGLITYEVPCTYTVPCGHEDCMKDAEKLKDYSFRGK